MVITTTLKKPVLEKIIKQTFLNFGNITTSQMLDSLKAFGFFYATSSGISIGLEDLKSPEGKEEIKENSNLYINKINKKWINGLLSDSERFQAILDHWFSAAELIKKEIIEYYKNYDPANSLYIMAFSGARGNISQVRQIVGIRGLMTNQSGDIISFPIKKNFREGLASIDYLISAYGARKGVVDTALKTAVAGYLTRRLVFLAQNVIIRELDCNTTESLIVDISRNSNCENLIGRYSNLALEYNEQNLNLIPILTNCFLTKKICNFLSSRKNKKIYLQIKSPLTCKKDNALCQKCYGWDLSKLNKISLGESVGVIAAQSIGEPGTQLTMRTFHTGGAFGSDLNTNFFSLPLSGKIINYKSFQGFYDKNIFGENILKLIKNSEIQIFHWKKGKKIFYLPKNLEFSLEKKFFIKKNEKIANLNASDTFLNYGVKKVIPIYSPIDGEIIEKRLFFKKIYNLKNNIFILNNSKISVCLGKFFLFHTKSKYRNIKDLDINKSMAFLNVLVAPYSGFLTKKEDFLILYTNNNIYYFDVQNYKKINKSFFLKETYSNTNNQILIFLENYQFIDKGTICARIESFPEKNEKIFKNFSKIQNEAAKKILFCIREEDIYSVCGDQISNLKIKLKIGDTVNFNNKISKSLKIPLKGKLIQKDGFLYTFHLIQSLFFPKGSLFYKKNQKYIFKNELISHSIIYKQQANDIVQGLPKIDQLIEAAGSEEFEPLLYSSSLFFNLKTSNLFLKNEKNISTKFFIKNFNLVFEKSKDKKPGNFLFQLENFFSDSNVLQKHKKRDNINLINILIDKISQSELFDIKLNLSNNFIYKNKNFFSIYRPDNHTDFYKQIKFFNFFQLSDELETNIIDAHSFLLSYYYYYLKKSNSTIESSILAFQKLQLLIINSIQAVYYYQGVKLSNKHIELIVRQLTSRVFVLNYNSQNFLNDEYTYISLLKLYKETIYQLLENFEKNIFSLKTKEKNSKYKNLGNYILNIENSLINCKIVPIYLGSSKNSLIKTNGFLASASFQETKSNLIEAAILGSKDWATGLQESLMAAKLIPAGSGYLAHKNLLDNIYYYKN
jgi:hypothetical protein